MALFGGGRSGSVGRESEAEAEVVEIWGRGRLGIQLRYPDLFLYLVKVFAKTFGFWLWLWFWRSSSLSRSGQIAQGTEISPLGGPRKDEAELFQNQRKQV
jgi:hypothetical protein